jgi:phage-related protein
MTEKALAWLGSSLADIRAFPAEAKRAAGYQLGRVQQGLMPDDWKPMTTVGAGVYEIRIHTGLEHRVFYVAKYEEAVYVIHAFEKRTARTREADIALARVRLADFLQRRARRRKEAR